MHRHTIGRAIILIWEKIPEELTVWCGTVSPSNFSKLKRLNSKYFGSEDEPNKELEGFVFNADKRVRFGEYGLRLVDIRLMPQVDGTLIVSGIVN